MRSLLWTAPASGNLREGTHYPDRFHGNGDDPFISSSRKQAKSAMKEYYNSGSQAQYLLCSGIPTPLIKI